MKKGVMVSTVYSLKIAAKNSEELTGKELKDIKNELKTRYSLDSILIYRNMRNGKLKNLLVYDYPEFTFELRDIQNDYYSHVKHTHKVCFLNAIMKDHLTELPLLLVITIANR